MEPSQDLAYYERKLRAAEDEAAAIALTLELDSALAGLRGHPGWDKLVDRLRTIEARETERLRYSEMSPYDLGKRQGRLITLASITSQNPLTEAEVADRRQRVTLLADTIAEYRNLLN